MDRALTIFAYVWLGLLVAANLAGIAGMFMGSETGGGGWARFAATYSPFNLITHALNAALAAPAIGALVWRNRRRQRQAR
jgi:hypothetical protein